MAIPTSRTKANAQIIITPDKCTGCGLCISVCKDNSLRLEKKKVKVNPEAVFGCYGCCHCMAICPTNAIKIAGRKVNEDAIIELPHKLNNATYEQLFSLLQHRRSIRNFVNKEIESGVIEKILNASLTAPMGIPPSDVHILIINGREKTRAFTSDFSNYLKGLRLITSKPALLLMRLFSGKAIYELFNGFIAPLFDVYTSEFDKGKNYITYDAPLLMYFYGSPYSDPADPIIAATYAMIAAESLGLGTCMLGAIHPFIQNGKKADEFRIKHKIKHKSKEGLFLAIGYPAVKYNKGIRRTFASIDYI